MTYPRLIVAFNEPKGYSLIYMISLVREKEKAIELRKNGYTYNEILRELPVAKSSLSLWLKDFPLTESEREGLQSRRNLNIGKGRIKAATSNKINRLEREKLIVKEAELEFEKRRWDPLFLVGVTLYWAHGIKSSSQVQFVSSNPEIIRVFILWLEKFLNLKREGLSYRLFLPRSYPEGGYEAFWANFLGITPSYIKKTVSRQGKESGRGRINYRGSLRVGVPKATQLVIKMRVWQKLLTTKYN